MLQTNNFIMTKIVFFFLLFSVDLTHDFTITCLFISLLSVFKCLDLLLKTTYIQITDKCKFRLRYYVL